jgi:RNA polymerase sigma-32 factor
VLPAQEAHEVGTPDGTATDLISEPQEESLGEASDVIEILPEDIQSDDIIAVEPLALESVEDAVDASPSEQTGLVRYDALSAYLSEMKRYPRLSKEEEHELAVKYHTLQDREAAYKLIRSNLWLVVKIAKDYERAARNVLDLIQEGNIGLMEAVKNFDPYRNVRFPSYAIWWIKAYIVRFVIANWRLVKIGTTQAQRKLFFNLKKEKARLEREGFFPAPKLLAEKLQVREHDIVEMEQRLASPDMSMDTPLDDDNETTLSSLLPAYQSNAEELVSQKQTQELLKRSLEAFEATLNEKERTIFVERMLGDDKITLQDMSDKLHVSRERIRQIEERVKEKLKVFLTERLGTSLEDIEL